MRKSLMLFVFIVALSAITVSLGAENVAFFQDTVSEIDGRVVEFLGGSIWLMEREIVALPLDDGIIITPGPAPEYDEKNIGAYMESLPNHGILTYQGNTVSVSLVEGIFILQNGFLAQVIASHEEGAVLEMTDGSFWSVPDYDQYDSGWWLPPYPVLIYENEMYLVNLKKGKKIWINRKPR